MFNGGFEVRTLGATTWLVFGDGMANADEVRCITGDPDDPNSVVVEYKTFTPTGSFMHEVFRRIQPVVSKASI